MSGDITGELERLAALRDRGAITDAEFEAQKARLLGTAPVEPAKPVKPVRKKGSTALGCLLLIVVVVVVLVLISVAGGNKGVRLASKKDIAAASPPPQEVSAKELARAYSANEARAQSDYGGQPLLVTGIVDGINLNIVDNPVVLLRTDNQFMPAQASLADASKPRAKDLDKGQPVKLLCQKVEEVLSTPMLSDCDLQ